MGADIQPYAWLILFAAFMGLFLNTSLNYSSGVIHVALLQKYPEEDVTNIAWLGSLFSCMFAFTGILASVIINTFNARVCVMSSGIFTVVGFTMSYFVQDFKFLFLTYGLIGGCGQGLCHTGCMVSLGYYFKEKIGMVSGIALSGCGLCIFVFPPLTQFLIDTYGLNGAFLIIGGIGFQATLFGALMTPTKYEKRTERRLCCKSNNDKKDYLIEKKVHHKSQSDLVLLRSFSVWSLMISTFCFSMALSTVYLLLPEYFIHHGSSEQEAALVLSVCGVTGILARVMLGFLSSSIDVSIVYSSLFGIIATVTLCLKVMTSLASKVTYTAMFGLYVGGCWVLHYNLVVECVGLKKLSTCYGMVMMIGGLGFLIGPPIAETIVEMCNDAYFAFVFASICFYVAGISGIFTKLMKKSENTSEIFEQKQDQTDESKIIFLDAEEDKLTDDYVTNRKENVSKLENSFRYIDDDEDYITVDNNTYINTGQTCNKV